MTRLRWVIGAAAVALLAGCGKPAEKKPEAAGAAVGKDASAVSPTARAMPQRRPGLWNQTMAMGGMTQTFKICLDVVTEKKLSMFGQQASEQACSQTRMNRRPDGAWEFASSCDMGTGGKIQTTGVATGDLTSKYSVKATSVTTGASTPQANGTFAMDMTAEWAGPCPPDFKPGDMELPGGMRMNITQMGTQAGA